MESASRSERAKTLIPGVLADKRKLIIVYVISALFIAANIFFVFRDFYWFALLPLALLVLLMFFFSLDKVLFLTVALTPLAVNISNFDSNLAISLPTEPLMFFIMLIFLIKMLFERNYDQRILKHPVTITIGIYLLWMFITSCTSEYPLISFKFLVSRLWFIIPFYFLTLLLFRKPFNIKIFGWFYAVPFVIVIVYSSYMLYTWAFDEQAAHWVMDPFYNDHTAYGAALAFFVPVFACFLFDNKMSRTQKLFAFIVFCFLLLGLYLSYSRAAWLSVAIALTVALIMIFKIRFRWVFLTLAVLIGAFLYFQQEILMKLEKNKQDSSANFVEHVQSISNISSDASNLERINRWQSALRMFRQRPVFGWGPGTYQFVYAPFQHSQERTIISTNAGDLGTAHSEYIGPLAEMGVMGLLTFLSIVISVSYTAIRLYRRSPSAEVRLMVMAYFLGLVTYFVHGTLNNFLDTDKSSVPFWGFTAIIVALDIYHRQGWMIPENKKAETSVQNTLTSES